MRGALERLLDSTRTIYFAAAASLVLGLFFVFVWAPHPWEWQGIDAYHDLARSIARGDGFPTTDVPWGYAYFAAAFYWLFGERVWIPLTVQVLLNATVPVMLYHLVRPLSTQRTAVLSTVIVGVFSFNTVYASTQVSDTICTVTFVAALLCFARGVRTDQVLAFVLSGVLFGIVPQFRPNMAILPGVMILAYLVLRARTLRNVTAIVLFAAMVVAVQLPWIVRNYQLTGLFLPTSTHGGMQLWYGTLQVGPYLESRSRNPRSAFEPGAFAYTSAVDVPIVISADFKPCSGRSVESAVLVFWTDTTPPQRIPPSERVGRWASFEIPPQPDGAVVRYYFEGRWPSGAGQPATSVTTPFEGAANPYQAFVSTDHFGDLDRHGEILDIFDVTRIIRYLAWGVRVAQPEQVDLDRDGQITDRDLAQALTFLLPESSKVSPFALDRLEVTATADEAVVRLADGSRLTVPAAFSGRQVDLQPEGEFAAMLVSRRRSVAGLSLPRPPRDSCEFVENVGFNHVFYRREPDRMQRYMALAHDNIKRDPLGFAAASAYRMFRLFIIRGTTDLSTAQQFRWSALAYGAGTLLSAAYFLVFLTGVVIAWRRRSALVLFLLPIVYVPLTICFVLTNMRYTVTVQPLMFVFVAVAVLAGLRLEEKRLS